MVVWWWWLRRREEGGGKGGGGADNIFRDGPSYIGPMRPCVGLNVVYAITKFDFL